MKKIKDPALFQKIKSFLTDYLPVIRKRSPNTVVSYRTALNIYLSYLQEKTHKQLYEITTSDFNAENILGFMEWLKTIHNNSAPTMNQRYSHIRQFCKYLMKHNLIDYTDYAEIQEIEKEPDCRKEQLLFLSVTDMKTILEMPDINKKTGLRDKFRYADDEEIIKKLYGLV